MSIRYQRYIINPATACPTHLRTSTGSPMPEVPLDIDEVARSAWSEILQTAPRSTSLFAFLEELLDPGPKLVWRGQGPGRGTEMRRSFSGLFGRFFARAYLETHHGFVWFAAIDGDNFHLSQHWRIKRSPGSKTEMPDWVCARPGELAIGEAKGSHQKGNVGGGGIPGPIKTADGQISGVQVQKLVASGRRSIWRPKRVKGWAVMSRWGLSNPSRDPFLYALDPETEGEKLLPEEQEQLVQAVAYTHVKQTAVGLGILPAPSGEVAAAPSRRVLLADDEEKRSFVGAVVTPFGPLNLNPDQAKELLAFLPDPNLIRFVGLEESLFTTYLEGGVLVPRQRQRIGDNALAGGDGLVVAPIDRIIDLGNPMGLT
jgi:hypothetical protein